MGHIKLANLKIRTIQGSSVYRNAKDVCIFCQAGGRNSGSVNCCWNETKILCKHRLLNQYTLTSMLSLWREHEQRGRREDFIPLPEG